MLLLLSNNSNIPKANGLGNRFFFCLGKKSSSGIYLVLSNLTERGSLLIALLKYAKNQENQSLRRRLLFICFALTAKKAQKFMGWQMIVNRPGSFSMSLAK
jgi:hypothetical protein